MPLGSEWRVLGCTEIVSCVHAVTPDTILMTMRCRFTNLSMPATSRAGSMESRDTVRSLFRFPGLCMHMCICTCMYYSEGRQVFSDGSPGTSSDRAAPESITSACMAGCRIERSRASNSELYSSRVLCLLACMDGCKCGWKLRLFVY